MSDSKATALAAYKAVQDQAMAEYQDTKKAAERTYDLLHIRAKQAADELEYDQRLLRADYRSPETSGESDFIANALAAKNAIVTSAWAKYQTIVAAAFVAYIETTDKIASGELS